MVVKFIDDDVSASNSLLRENLSVELKKQDFYFSICHNVLLLHTKTSLRVTHRAEEYNSR